MATRLYPDVYTAASSFPTRSSIWDDASASPLRYKLDRARFGAGVTLSATYVETSATSGFQAMLWQCVSEPLDGDQTISGTWRGLARCHESTTAANFISQTVIRVFSGDMTTERGVLYGGNSETTVIGEWATSTGGASMVPQNFSTNGGIPLDTSLTTVNALDGDVIVVEFGFKAINTSTTGYTATATLYNNQNTTSYPDYPTISGSGSVTWIEFSQNLLFVGDQAFGDADDIDVPFDLTATMTTPVSLSLAGSIDVNVDPAATLTVTNRRITPDDYRAYILSTSPWLFWPADEGSGAVLYDASGNGRNGTITGSGILWKTLTPVEGGQIYSSSALRMQYTSNGEAKWTGTVPTTAAATSNGFSYMYHYYNDFGVGASVLHGGSSTSTFQVDGVSGVLRAYVGGTYMSLSSGSVGVVLVRYNATTDVQEQWYLGAMAVSRTSTTPTANSTYFRIFHDNTYLDGSYYNIAYWDRPLTDEEVMVLSGSYIDPPTPQAVAGDVDLDVGLDGTLSLTHPLVGEIDLDVDLTATNSTLYPLSGEVTEDVDLTGTATFTVLLDGTLDVDVSLDGDLTVGIEINPLALDGAIDLDVSLEGDLFVPERLLLAGAIDLDFDLYADSFEESFRAGTLDIPFDLTATLFIVDTAEQALADIELDELTGTVQALSLLLVEPLMVTTDTYLSARVRSALVIPPAPEPAVPGEIPVAGGTLLRALHGIVVTMETPAIEDGQPS